MLFKLTQLLVDLLCHQFCDAPLPDFGGGPCDLRPARSELAFTAQFRDDRVSQVELSRVNPGT